MLLSCYHSKSQFSNELFYWASYLPPEQRVRVYNFDNFLKLSIGYEGNEINALMFAGRNQTILAIKSHKSHIIENIVGRLNAFSQTTGFGGFEELKFSDSLMKYWVRESAQILECNIESKYTGGETKVVAGNLLKSSDFLTLLDSATVTRLMFTLKEDMHYLITAKANGKVVITPDPNEINTVKILSLLLSKIEVFLA